LSGRVDVILIGKLLLVPLLVGVITFASARL
jgi:hypothetical protein